MSDGGGKAKAIPWSDDDKLALVVRLLFHQGQPNWKGFEIRTDHSQKAASGVLDRLRKQYVTEADTAQAEGDGAKKSQAKGVAKKKTAKTADVKKEDGEDETSAAEGEKTKRKCKASKKVTEAEATDGATDDTDSKKRTKSKTPGPEASTESKKRSKSKTPGAEPAAKKSKTGVATEV